MAEHSKDSLVEHLPACMEIIFQHCLAPNSYTLAILYRLIRSLSELLSPYLNKLLISALDVESPHSLKFIEDVSQFLAPSTLIVAAKAIHKEVSHMENFTLFLREVVKRGVGDAIFKTIQHFMVRSMLTRIEEEESLETIIGLQGQIIVEMALKLN